MRTDAVDRLCLRDLQVVVVAVAIALGTSVSSVVVADDNIDVDGAYTEAQAAKGESLYDSHCASCHGSNLEGKSAVALSGALFNSRWADGKHTIDDLLYIVRTLMPYEEPGKLSRQEYVDIVAFILRVNGYPTGLQDLPLDAKVLKTINLKRPHP
jgi:cytochrome c